MDGDEFIEVKEFNFVNVLFGKVVGVNIINGGFGVGFFFWIVICGEFFLLGNN